MKYVKVNRGNICTNKISIGNVIFRFGEIGDLFYIVLSGAVGVQVPTEKKLIETSSKNSKKRSRGSDRMTMMEVAELTTGTSFGELALINSKPRAATIICKETPTELIT
jgi:CRP-like cAMP-binding protein